MVEVLNLLDLLNSFIDRQILDGSDVLSNGSASDDDRVRRGKAFIVVNSLLYSYDTMRHTLVLQLHWVVLCKLTIFYPIVE